jgi:hypothetical protein
MRESEVQVGNLLAIQGGSEAVTNMARKCSNTKPSKKKAEAAITKAAAL